MLQNCQQSLFDASPPPNASKLPTVTGMETLEVAILVTVVVFDG